MESHAHLTTWLVADASPEKASDLGLAIPPKEVGLLRSKAGKSDDTKSAVQQ